MEIFQTIWTALTTENLELTQILTYPLGIIDIFIPLLFFTLILNIPANKKQKVSYVIILYIIAIFSKLFIPAPFSSCINLIASPILIMIIFRAKFLKSIMATLIPYIIFALVAIVVHNLYLLLFNISTDMLVCVPLHNLSSSILLYCVIFLIYKIIKHFKLNIYLLDDLKHQINSTLIINFIFGIIAVSLQATISSLYSDIIPFYVTLLNLGVLLLYFMFSLYSLIRTNSLERTKRDLEQSQQYNKTLTILHDNIRCFKHDFNNIVTTIGGYVQSGDTSGLQHYYHELVGDCQKINNLSALSPTVINDPAVYSLLTNKYHLADEKGITIHLEVFLDLTDLHMKMYEFTRILRNFIR